MDSIPKHHNQHNIFDIPIWGFILENEKYHAADYLEYILELKKNYKSDQRSNFGGWHSRCNLHHDGIFCEFASTLTNIANDIGEPYARSELQITDMWAIVNPKYSYNANHVHEGFLSGVFYLQVPQDSGRLILSNPALRSHNHSIKNSDYPIEPEKLSLIMFPSWLEHYVEQNKSNEERVVISFNIGEK